MAALFFLEVHTPYRLFYSNQVQAIALTLIDGEAAVYANHVPFTAPVVPCLLRIKNKEGKWETAFTAEGILEVKKGKTILVSDVAEWPAEIDCERAKAAKKKADEILHSGCMKFEKMQAVSSLRRAAMRLKAYTASAMPEQ